ncbi:MAG: hypothetical protein LBS35_06565 [Synergistaceae bacterium]|jgi:hypothetical protein|nr:hypothetical protein [Synergistaceae bacterium]
MLDEQQVQERSDSELKEENLLKRIWSARSDHSEIVSAAVFFVIIIIGMRMLATGSAKPVIYLYPESPLDVTVRLDYNGTLEHTYPKYNDGWTVTAYPNGTLINRDDGLEYSYLFWDGKTNVKYDFSRGFVVKGSDTAIFLREKLAYIGLTPREYNEFIVYWLPLMEKNPYNLVSFQGDAYTKNAVLSITPEPDSVLRVFMAFKPLSGPINITPQALVPFVRRGFAVVEWGGSLVR